MQMIGRQSFEVQTGNRNYQFILNSDSPIDEYLEVLVSVHQHFQNVKEKAQSQEASKEEAIKEG